MKASNKNIRERTRDEVRYVLPSPRLKKSQPTGLVIVDDPNPNAGLSKRQTVVATRSLRSDILAQMHDRGTINEMQYLAGRRWQSLYERALIGGGSPDPTRPIVDGGRIAEPFTLQVRDAVAKLNAIDKELGKQGRRIVRLLLADGLSFAQCAQVCNGHSVETPPRRAVEAMSHRLREILTTLADEFGLIRKGGRP